MYYSFYLQFGEIKYDETSSRNSTFRSKKISSFFNPKKINVRVIVKNPDFLKNNQLYL